MEQLKEMKKTLTCKLKAYLDNGIGEADVNEVKETVDAIKDLCEAIYYCTVTEAMEKGEEYPYDERMGYSQPHYKYGTAGMNSSRMGYHDDHVYKPMVDQEPYIQDYLEWKNAKRHYNETHSASDKSEWDMKTSKNFNNLIENAREMYNDADLAKRQEMKSDLLTLINAM